MSKLNDTKIPITEFLEAYRRQPCLYNSLLDTYKNRESREEAYGAIIRALKIPQLTVVDIKLKIKSVRTVYSKELRIWMREKELGRSYEPKLFWFKLADSFLRSVSLSHSKKSKNKNGSAPQTPIKSEAMVPSVKMLFNTTADISMSEDALEEEEEEDETAATTETGVEESEHHEQDTQEKAAESNCLISVASERTGRGKSELIIDDCMVEEPQHQPRQPQHMNPPPFAPHPSLHQPGPPAQRKMKYNPTGCEPASDDELMIFGQSIASQLRNITDSYSRSVAKLRIQQVLFEAETGHFQNVDATSPPQLQHTF
ncbi:uncharacterized protein [Drosophila bipectinata]|uniref:uncharacterized protein n=1 Tax=Drosophila bipectinata TaxID=42026 RepID=UPI001C8A3472|nr:uncharacterized protein LOC108120096 [Drosophila bipectinata]